MCRYFGEHTDYDYAAKEVRVEIKVLVTYEARGKSI